MHSPRPFETPVSLLQERRRRAFEALGDGVLVLPSAPVLYASRDTDVPYRADSELFYLTGVTEPSVVAVFFGAAAREWALFVPARDPETELWSGPMLGPEEAAERFGPDACHPLSELGERLPGWLQRGDRIFYRRGREDAVERMVFEALALARSRGARTGSGPRGIVDPGEALDELRLRKDGHEIGLIRRATAISEAGHREGAAIIGPGVGEWEVEATLSRRFRAAGGGGAGFGTIVGSGANACVLHYRDNRDLIAAGSLVLVDAGAEYGLYHGDITRTYPAGGRYSPTQREIYDLVEAARVAAVGAIAPGRLVSDVHDAATRVLVDGLVALGLLRGELDGLIATGAQKAYFPHQTSHWLGLDVHDPGDYAREGVSRSLEPGMVLTVEPGLYFRSAAEGPAAGFAGIGIRIEDDVLVTPEGCDVLTGTLPTAPEALEALVAGAP